MAVDLDMLEQPVRQTINIRRAYEYPADMIGLGGGWWGDWRPLTMAPKLTARRSKPNPNAKKQAAAKRARKITRRKS